MRSCSSDLATAIAQECTTLARLWRVTRADTTVLRFTDNDRDITYSGDLYKSSAAFTASAIFTSSSLANAQNMTFKVALDASGITEKDIRSGLYKAAKSELMVVDYTHPEYGVLVLFEGVVDRIRISDKRVADTDVLPKSVTADSRVIGSEVYSGTCRNSLGDSDCTIDLNALKVAFTVDSATGTQVVASEFSQADDAWAQGYIQWATGDNAGTTTQVRTNLQADSKVILISKPGSDVQVGDTGFIFPACDKAPVTCLNKFANMVHFRGEHLAPTQDIVPYIPMQHLVAG
jgi:uncharacterized phage protein (TIGR02218 family)